MERSIMLLIGKPSISISHLYHGYVKITRWYQTLPNWSLYVHFLLNRTGGIRSSYFRVSIMRPAWLHVWGKVQASSAQIKKSLSNNLPEILVEWHLYHSLYIPISWSGFMRGDNIFCCQSPHHPPLGGSPFLSNCFASARIVTGNIWEPGWTRDWNGWTQFSGTSLWILIHEQSEIWICSPTEMIPKKHRWHSSAASRAPPVSLPTARVAPASWNSARVRPTWWEPGRHVFPTGCYGIDGALIECFTKPWDQFFSPSKNHIVVIDGYSG